MNPPENADFKQTLQNEMEGFYDSAPCGFVYTQLDGTIANANATFLNWIGQAKEAIFDLVQFRDTLTIGSKIYYETNYSPLLRMQGFLTEISLDLKTKDGGLLPVLVNSHLVSDSKGKPALIGSTLFNISDRRSYEKALLKARKTAENSEAALKESHEWFETTLGSIGDAVITIAVDKTISYLNKVAEGLTGWNLADAIGRPMDEVFQIINDQTGKRAFNPVDQVLAEGIPVGLASHTALIRKDSTKIIIEDSAAPIKNETSEIKGVVLVFRDVTLKHREEQERIRLVEELTREKENRETFIATLTHDLRNPLSAVKMSAQLILRKSDQIEVVQSLATRVISGMERADQMIQDLLNINSLRAGEKISVEKEAFELYEWVAETLADLSTVHGDRFTLTGIKPVYGFWNRSTIRRAIENLVNNAVKYGNPSTSIAVSIETPGTMVVLSVHNFGSAISATDQANLFSLYNRTGTARDSVVKGWGIGLTLVRGVAEAHGGKVTVESSPEQGTTFFLELPRDSRE